jgi:hypothetical protein
MKLVSSALIGGGGLLSNQVPYFDSQKVEPLYFINTQMRLYRSAPYARFGVLSN